MSASGLSDAPTMREVLPVVIERFGENVKNLPQLILMNIERDAMTWDSGHELDWFGTLSSSTYRMFASTARECSNNSDHRYDDELLDKLAVAQLGIGVISLYAELVPLLVLTEEPDAELTSEEAGSIARDGYDFIEGIIESGGKLGATLVREYVLLEEGKVDPWDFHGAIVGQRFVRPERLTRFALTTRDDGQRLVRPRSFDSTKSYFRSQLSEGDSSRVTCPAQIYRDPDTDQTFARKLFDTIIDYTEAYMYPGYIPLARRVLSAQIDGTGRIDGQL